MWKLKSTTTYHCIFKKKKETLGWKSSKDKSNPIAICVSYSLVSYA